MQRWSLSLGRWWGIPVRLHIFFILFAVLAMAFTAPPSFGALSIGVLFASLLLHEMGHAVAAVRVGGKVDGIVVGPTGGLVSPRVPDEPEVHLFVALAGPMVHLALVVAAATALAVSGHTNIVGLLQAVPPVDLGEEEAWLAACKVTVWLNWILMLLNLLPAYPFDGGAILRSMLWPALGRRTARVVTARVAMVAAIGLAVAGLATAGGAADASVPLWIPLVTLGIFLFFSAEQDLALGDGYERFDDAAGRGVSGDGVDLLEAGWSNEVDDDAVLVEYQQRQQLEQHRRAQEAYEDARVDAILARLHDSSLADLSREDLNLLRRASERYRHRQPPKDEA